MYSYKLLKYKIQNYISILHTDDTLGVSCTASYFIGQTVL